MVYVLVLVGFCLVDEKGEEEEVVRGPVFVPDARSWAGAEVGFGGGILCMLL